MRYFTDARISEMKESVKNDLSDRDRSLYLAYLSEIQQLDERNDKYGDCREQLLQAIAGLEKLTESYVHRGKTDPNDEDADAYEYENYDFRREGE